MENSERLDRQARPRYEPGISRLPVCESSHWWGQGRTARHPCLTRDSNPGSWVQQPASLTTSPPVDAGVFVFQGFLNNSIQEIRKSKNPGNESLNKLLKNYYFGVLVVKYLKNPRTQTPLHLFDHSSDLQKEFLVSSHFMNSVLRIWTCSIYLFPRSADKRHADQY